MAKLFEDHELRFCDLDTLKTRLRRKLGGYTVAIKNIDTSNLLYRGVAWAARPRLSRELSYPPAERARLGRANRTGQPIFYGSRGAPPVFYELRAKRGDCIALSEWRVNQSFWFHHLGYHEAALKQLGGSGVPPRPALMRPIPNETRFNRKLRRKLSLAFTERIDAETEYRYKQTVAISELLFDKAAPLPRTPTGPQIDRAGGIVYPTAQMHGTADNVAIWPDFVDACLALQSVRYVLIEDSDEERASYSFLVLFTARDFRDGEIIWDEISAPEDARRSHISFENGNWIQRDGLGRVYDVH
jgi:hypothetical protein